MHDIRKYVDEAALLDQPWDEAMDEQILQKVLPKLARTDPAVGDALSRLIMLAERYDFTLSRAKAEAMLEGFQHYGFASYF